MKILKFLFSIFFICLFSTFLYAVEENQNKKKPNFLIIMTDDMGYSDTQPFGGEIATPNIENLAKDGVRVSNFYTSPTCSPTRSMLLTGVDNHQNGVGAMIEVYEARYPKKIPNQVGYLGVLNNKVVTIAEVLKENGYNTIMSGKWHLGGYNKTLWPVNRGFEKSFAYLQGLGTHIGQPQPLLFPPFNKATLIENDKVVKVPNDWYSSVGYTDKLLEYLKEDSKNGKPFFAYLAFTAVHDPIQAPKINTDKFKGVYDKGYDVLRKQRYEKMVKMGFLSGTGGLSQKLAPKWEDLSYEEKKREIKIMEVYAGMIDVVDEQIGRVINYLKKTNQYYNTMIIFLSDNGPSSVYLEDYNRHYKLDKTEVDNSPETPWKLDKNGNPIKANDKQSRYLAKHFNQSYENIGNGDSAATVGPGWAQASASPFKMWKGETSEGGVRTPIIIKWDKMDKKKIGSIDTNAIGHVSDFASTIYDLAKVEYPSTYKGNKIRAMNGESMVPFLKGESSEIHKDYIAWELHGSKALRKGNWKILWIKQDPNNKYWALYNLESNPSETIDLSKQYPEKLKELIALYNDYSKKQGVYELK